jgi:uncharacterized protein YndB with AHSA1/START domain
MWSWGVDAAQNATVPKWRGARVTGKLRCSAAGALAPRSSRCRSTRSKGRAMPTGTVKLHRVLRATPERVYRAFLDADAMAKWLPPHGFTGKVHQLDARVGGTYRMSFTNFGTGQSHAFGGTYRELVPNERLRYTGVFEGGLAGEMQTTVDLKRVSCGVEIHVVQEGIPEMIPAEMCYLGWQESLVLLAHVVEPEIPG